MFLKDRQESVALLRASNLELAKQNAALEARLAVHQNNLRS